jgi:hypothetical protein
MRQIFFISMSQIARKSFYFDYFGQNLMLGSPFDFELPVLSKRRPELSCKPNVKFLSTQGPRN